MRDVALSVSNFSLELGGAEILKDVTFNVQKGDYLSIVGPNGAGKTTLLKCLNRVLTGGSGDIRILDRPLEELSQRELAQMVSYVPQLDGRSLPFTAAEFMAMGRYPYLSSFSGIREQDRRELNDAASQAGIEDLLDRQLDTLSGGERQKVFIAAALAQGAQIMLLDEPTTFLDYRHQVEVGRLLSRLNREGGKTVLAVTHDLNSALDGCNRALALKHGKIVFDGPPVELLQEARLKEIYRTGFTFIEQPGSDLPFIRPWEAL